MKMVTRKIKKEKRLKMLRKGRTAMEARRKNVIKLILEMGFPIKTREFVCKQSQSAGNNGKTTSCKHKAISSSVGLSRPTVDSSSICLLVAPKRLYKSACPSVRRSVGPSVGPSVRNAFAVMLLPTRSDLCRVYGLVISLFRCVLYHEPGRDGLKAQVQWQSNGSLKLFIGLTSRRRTKLMNKTKYLHCTARQEYR